MKCHSKFNYSIAFALVGCVLLGYAQTSVAQLTPDLSSGLVVTASDDADFLGQTLFPSSAGSPFQFDSAVLDFGFVAPLLEFDDDGNIIPPDPNLEPVVSGSQDTIGTFVNSTATYGIGDSSNTVAAGIALSSGLVENYSGGANFDASTSGFLGTVANDQQASLLEGLSDAATDFQDVTSLSINFTNTTQTDQVLDLFAVFGTEETPDFVGTSFNDAFGVFLNGENIALQDGLVLNVDHPNQLPTFGTELDTVITSPGPNGGNLPYVDLTTTVGVGQHELTLVIADASDTAFDSTAFLARDISQETAASVALLPDTISQDGDFIFEDVSIAAGEPLFIDPDIAIGYDYSVEELAGEAEAVFQSVRFDPTGFDVDYTIRYEDANGEVVLVPVTAGEVFVFPESVDVLAFSVEDIDPFQFLPPDSPVAFATLVTFRNDLNNATIIQSPDSILFSQVPEPSSTVLLFAGMSAAAMLRRRR